ncbi:hypothetical protein LOD99_14605 [Oopsacas minuta]|uniref:Uncharacterized protein n=1 Tax=Oopsacas minuta TaxID=111878 RepID=A0AAV7KH82_9METZ|nr:hypothetical protein LOD99_14605 [Oopsacas minuta]
MFSHTDPTTLEKTCILAASFIKHYLMKVYSHSIESERNFFSIFPHLLKTLLRLLKSTDAMAVRASCLAMKCCLPELLHYCYSGLVVQAIKEYMNVRFHSFWLVRVELCSLLSVINWSGLAMLEATSTNNCSLQVLE